MGTLINMLGIVLGGMAGLLGRRLLSDRLQASLLQAMGLCVMFLGIGGTMEKMLALTDGSLTTQGSMMMIVSFTLGTLLGELINISARLEQFGQWLKIKSGNAQDATFVHAFVHASFTVCIGAMAIVGALQDGLLGDSTTLILKAILDCIIIMVMAAAMGKGCIFSAIPVGILQGSVNALAQLISPFMTDAALNHISLVGSVLIFCVGANLIWENKFKVANMLPAVLFAVILGFTGLL